MGPSISLVLIKWLVKHSDIRHLNQGTRICILLSQWLPVSLIMAHKTELHKWYTLVSPLKHLTIRCTNPMLFVVWNTCLIASLLFFILDCHMHHDLFYWIQQIKQTKISSINLIFKCNCALAPKTASLYLIINYIFVLCIFFIYYIIIVLFHLDIYLIYKSLEYIHLSYLYIKLTKISRF